MTICNQWSWKPDDRMKSLKECLVVLVRCAGGDGNLLFNVGPMPDGEIEPRQAKRLREMGRWLEWNGESIYGTRGGPYLPNSCAVNTYRGKTIYLHLLQWPRDRDTVRIPAPGVKVVSARLLRACPQSGRFLNRAPRHGPNAGVVRKLFAICRLKTP